jgi:hypothetical protein
MPILSDHKQTEQLTDQDFTALRRLLKLIRHDQQWIKEFISGLSHLAEDEKLAAAHVSAELIQAWQNDPLNKASQPGVLQCIGEAVGLIESAFLEIDENEFLELQNYLAVLRSGTWLADRISSECDFFVLGRRYTPTDIIRHITGAEVEAFQLDVETSKDMLRDYPQLFKDDLAALKAQEPPAATPTQNPAKKGAGKGRTGRMDRRAATRPRRKKQAASVAR